MHNKTVPPAFAPVPVNTEQYGDEAVFKFRSQHNVFAQSCEISTSTINLCLFHELFVCVEARRKRDDLNFNVILRKKSFSIDQFPLELG